MYVNYARIEDFLYLTTNLSLDLSNHICISRYGGIFRGDKVREIIFLTVLITIFSGQTLFGGGGGGAAGPLSISVLLHMSLPLEILLNYLIPLV